MPPEIGNPSVVFSATSANFSHWSVWFFHTRQCGKTTPKDREGNKGRRTGDNRPPCGSAVLGRVCRPRLKNPS
jgi:hypothetical protein